MEIEMICVIAVLVFACLIGLFVIVAGIMVFIIAINEFQCGNILPGLLVILCALILILVGLAVAGVGFYFLFSQNLEYVQSYFFS